MQTSMVTLCSEAFKGSPLCWAEKAMTTPLQYSCLENPMDGGAWWAAVHGVAKSQTQLSDFTFTFHALEKEMAKTLQCFCLENPRDRGAWWAAIYGAAQSRTRLTQLSSSSIMLEIRPALHCMPLGVPPSSLHTSHCLLVSFPARLKSWSRFTFLHSNLPDPYSP